MERLTKRNQCGAPYLVNVDNAILIRHLSHRDSVLLRDAIERLAAYEDRGVEPENTLTAVDMAKAACALEERKAYKDSGLTPERVAELAQAEKDGRLVVLPKDKAAWIRAILAERDRQDKKWGSPQENTYCEWSSILAEEVGELAKELNELNFGRGDVNRMEVEAVQVAAVALSLLEQSVTAYQVTVRAVDALGRLAHQEAEHGPAQV